MRTASLLCPALLLLAACGERPVTRKGDVTPADVIAGAAESLDHFESAEGKFGIDFPPVWKGNYTTIARVDTTAGSHFMVEFRFKPTPAMHVPPQTLLAVRIFTKAAWEKVASGPNQHIGILLGQGGDNAFVLSLAPRNPYPAGTDAADLFDKMMLGVFNQKPRFIAH